jgi:hypothetical protein
MTRSGIRPARRGSPCGYSRCMRGVACAAFAFAVAGLFAPAARAEPAVVLVLDSREGPPLAQFVRSLDLHLGGSARVRVGGDAGGGTLAERVIRATDRARVDGAALVLWIDYWPALDSDELAFVAHVVGSGAERVLLEVIRVRASERTEAARVISLKVASLLDAILLSAPEGEAGADIARGLVPVPGPAGERRARWQGRLETILACCAGNSGAQVGAGLGAGALFSRGGFSLGGRGAIRWLSPVNVRSGPGAVEVDELDAALALSLARALGRVALGGEFEVGARILSASGRVEDGRTGSTRAATPIAAAAVTGDLRLAATLGMQASAGLESSLVRQRFFILDELVTDLGRVRPFLRISLVWTR